MVDAKVFQGKDGEVFVHIVTFGKKLENLLSAIEFKRIGSNSKTVENHFGVGHIVMLHCDSLLWGMAEITGAYEFSSTLIWSDRTYPHRFKIGKIKLFSDPCDLGLANLKSRLKEQSGIGWAYKYILSPRFLPFDLAKDLQAAAMALPEMPIEAFNEKIEIEIEKKISLKKQKNMKKNERLSRSSAG